MARPTRLIETASGLFRPLRGALRASKSLARFVEQTSILMRHTSSNK